MTIAERIKIIEDSILMLADILIDLRRLLDELKHEINPSVEPDTGCPNCDDAQDRTGDKTALCYFHQQEFEQKGTE